VTTADPTPSTPTVVHLVPHTHWDREWYEPFQAFRLRLVALVDELLARMEADPRMRFTLDGQCATVDDYLELRPAAEPLVRRLVAEGRLAIGPWQILMDEFLASGETIVRNLELGWARATELGRAMPVGYLPDMFGHIAQIPQILRRAGIERAVVWRGVPAAIDRNAFIWRAPDGSEVETEYLVGGYGNGAYLFDVPDRLGSKLAGYVAANAAFYGERSVLAMYGTDHAVPTPRLTELVEAINQGRTDVVVRIETLTGYADRASTDGADDRTLPDWTGELRSGARANMLMNVTSARIDQKIAGGRAERLIERYTEPLTALHGAAWPARELELAWRRLVDNSAHDSICGCSHDEVVAQVLLRYAEVEQIGRALLRTTLGRIATRVPAGRWAVVNPSPDRRDDVVELDVAVPPEWDAVAIRVDGHVVPTQEVGRADPLVASLRLRGADVPELFARRRHGRELFGRQINGARTERGSGGGTGRITVVVDDVADPPELDVEELLAGIDAVVLAEPDATWDLVVRATDRRRLVAAVPAPALGFATVEVVEAAAAPGSEALDDCVVATERSLANGLVRVDVDEDGSFRLTGGGTALAGVGRIVDGGDFGDSYNFGPPTPDVVVERPSAVSWAVAAEGPVRGELVVHRCYDWPIGVDPAGRGRTAEALPTEVVTRLELRAGEPFVRVRVEFENRSRDHRVRCHIPLPSAVTGSSAEGQFAVVERGLSAEAGHGEVPLPTFPARSFVSVDGVTVLLDQMTEYEVIEGRELALTVLRSFGLISRNANPYREDPAGPEIPVPAAQLLGPRTFTFALAPHAGRWTDADAHGMAERYRHPFLVVRGTGRGDLAAEDGRSIDRLRLTGTGIVLSALRRRDDWLELRLVAEHPEATEAIIDGAFTAAREVDLLGRPISDLTVAAGTLRLPVRPWEIRTIQLRPVAG